MAVTVLEVVRPGLLTTVQDLGRVGLGRFGVSPAGAMDPLALALANALVGNAPDAPALELTGPGAELLCLADRRFALSGGDLGARLDGRPLPAVTSLFVRAGQRLSFTQRRAGARAMVAVAGGFAVPRSLGSAACDLSAGLGPPPLRRGDRLQAGDTWGAPVALAALSSLTRAYLDPFTLRFVPEEDPAVPAEARAAFVARPLRLSERSNRTGFRFTAGLPARTHGDRLSEPTAPGAIQLPPDGDPILLMADRNTTGGYPRLGHLAAADRPKAAQLWPGDQVRFRAITAEEARALLRV